MKKYIAFLMCVVFVSTLSLNAQNNIPKHAISFELGGRGLLYSINYEYQFADNFVATAGISFLHLMESEIDKSSELISYPVSVNYLLELSEEHYAELGVGVMNLITTGDLVEYSGNTDYFLNPTLLLGYRYKPTDSRWHFKAMATPFFGTKSPTNDEGTSFQPLGAVFQIWGGLSVGYEL